MIAERRGAGTPPAPRALAAGPPMQLTVKLFATFRAGRFEVAQLDAPAGATVGSIVDGLGIARDEIGIVMVAGRHADLDQQPSPGDTVSIFPLVGGG